MSGITKREYIKFTALVSAYIAVLFFAFTTMPKKGEGVWINCTWSEISPDFSPKMKEACRQARLQNAQKDLQKPK